jgi:hypothetical protein
MSRMKGERIKWEASVTFRVEQEGFPITSPRGTVPGALLPGGVTPPLSQRPLP